MKVISRKRQRQPEEASQPPYFPVGASLQCCFVDNAWNLVTLKPLPTPEGNRQRCRDRDILFDRLVSTITDADARRDHGSAVHAVARRGLAKRELRQYPIPVELWK